MALGVGFTLVGFTGDIRSMPAGRLPVVLAGAAFFFAGFAIFSTTAFRGRLKNFFGVLLPSLIVTALLGVPAMLFLGWLGPAAVVVLFTGMLTVSAWSITRKRAFLVAGLAVMVAATATTVWFTRPPYSGPAEAPLSE